MSILDELFEDVVDTTVESVEKDSIADAISYLKASSVDLAKDLHKEFEEVSKMCEDIQKSLDKLGDKSSELSKGLFDGYDALRGEFIKLSDITLMLAGDPLNFKKGFKEESFLVKISKLLSDLKKQFEYLRDESVDVKKDEKKEDKKEDKKEEKEEPIEEGFDELIAKATEMIDKIKEKIVGWVDGYKKKLDDLQKSIEEQKVTEKDKKDEEVKEAFYQKANNLLGE